MNGIDWTLLQTFLAVAKHGSFSQAARRENLAQPTISRHIAQLEDALGYRTLERSRSGITLTPQGQALLEKANEMARAAALISRGERSPAESLSGTVRITASRIVSTFLLPDMLSKLRLQEPEIAIELIASDETDNLLLREADIALRMFRPSQPDVITKRIADLEMGAFASHEYLKRHGEPKKPIDILTHSVIGYDRSRLIIDGFKRAGLTVDRDFFAFRSDDQVVCWNMVCAGFGIGFNQKAVGRNEARVAELKHTGLIDSLPIWLTAHSAVKSDPRIRRVYDFLASSFNAIV